MIMLQVLFKQIDFSATNNTPVGENVGEYGKTLTNFFMFALLPSSIRFGFGAIVLATPKIREFAQLNWQLHET